MNLAQITQRLTLYEKLMRLDKPIGTLLLLWPTLWGLWIASGGRPGWMMVWIFCLGTLLMRSAGCVMNDLADRNFDAHVKRTRDRPLAAGLVSVKEALWLAAALTLAAFFLVLALNRLTIGLSFVALALAASYPFTKRFVAVPQAYLGVTFGFGIPMAFAAVSGILLALCWWLLLANIFWVLAYDTEYAMVDRDDDLKIGIRTSAILFGHYDVAAVMLCYAAMLAVFVIIGMKLHFGLYYYLGLVAAGFIMLYHYSLIRERRREGCFKAFLHNNWVGGVIFAGIAANYVWR
ncbi:MAG: 4-hydroxybenzoate polyprenyltransferase [Betaproteobacteria bacterium RIFCSPLOWO2_12_FULL_64_23]|nr:MAG: 4-hydroxybenzoate polyprenyltransferase [Betaproteobacteria bacterium RIFCSPLOWO2_12_FULL_64_23]